MANVGTGANHRGPFLLLLFLVLTLVVINVSNWFVLSRVTASVDDELGLRLATVASTAVTTATRELLLEPDVAHDAFVRRTLEEIARRHDLEDVFLVDPDGLLLFALDGSEPGERQPFLDLDFVAFTKAAAGVPSWSSTRELSGAALKAGYAPVEDWDGSVRAVLGVTAGGGFSARVPALRRTLVLASAISAALVALLGAVFFGMTRRLARTEAALTKSETLSAMGIMAAGVAHEVRNPLAIIAGSADRLKKKYAPPEGDALFDFIPEEVGRLNGIVEGYLRFARDEPLRFAECDLASLAERTARLVADEFGDRGIDVRTSPSQGPVPTHLDVQRMQQVLLNLLLNSAQAIGENGTITIEVARDGASAVLRVDDTGTGFGAAALKGAFQPFYTTKEQGSGLGLSVAKRIVEGHGGSITLGNRPEGGARVSLEIPLDPGARSAEEA